MVAGENSITQQFAPPNEPHRTQEFFLTRALDPQGIIAVLQNKGLLNTDKEHGETKFANGFNKYFDIPDIGNKNAYGRGGPSIGIFIIFPVEATQLGVSKLDSGSVYGNEVTIDKTHQITYGHYFFAEPQELPLIKECKSKAEAEQILGTDREQIRQHAIEQASKLIELRTELGDLLKRVPHEKIRERASELSKKRAKGEKAAANFESSMSINGLQGLLNIEKTSEIVEELKTLI